VDSLSAVYDSARVRTALQDVDAARLSRQLDADVDGDEIRLAGSQLRVAAFLSLSEIIGDRTVDSLLRQLAAEPDNGASLQSGPQGAFAKWAGYLGSLKEAGVEPSIDDLLFFCTAGLLARQPVAVRHLLREPSVRQAVDKAVSVLVREGQWNVRVTTGVSVALLLLIRQEHHEDVSRAGEVISGLVRDQRSVERPWLDAQADSQRDAVGLLGLYHLAQAVVRTSEFLLAGSVNNDGQLATDIGVELRRLLVKAEEYLTLSQDLETRFWLNSLAILLWRLRSDSIWVSGQGISGRLDALLKELSKMGRDRPVFSLLPSQQDAIRQSLLDPSRIAIVLQMPTSAGKTLLAEFSIVQAFEAYKENTRAVYVVPTRALATQVRRVLSEDLRPLGIQVAAAGSAFEEDPFELELLLSTDDSCSSRHSSRTLGRSLRGWAALVGYRSKFSGGRRDCY
jgi:helicase